MSTAASARFRLSGEIFRGFVLLCRGQVFLGGIVSLEACRAEEDDGVLDLFAAEAGERFLIFGEHAKNAAVGAVEEMFVLIGDGSGFQVFSHSTALVLQLSFAPSGLRHFRVGPRRLAAWAVIFRRFAASAQVVQGTQINSAGRVARDSAAPPRNRSRCRANRGRCTCRGRIRWKPRCGATETRVAGNCRSTPGSMEG